MLPADKAGLHCGPTQTFPTQTFPTRAPGRQGRAPLRPNVREGLGADPARAPGRQGRAPLRPNFQAGLGPDEPGAPGRQGRAPLRPHGYPRRHGLDRVLPADKAGLHCGWKKSLAMVNMDGCSRPTRPGSIAAASCGELPIPSRPGAPGRQGRAPLRRCRVVHRTESVTRAPGREGRAPLRQRHRRGLIHLNNPAPPGTLNLY